MLCFLSHIPSKSFYSIFTFLSSHFINDTFVFLKEIILSSISFTVYKMYCKVETSHVFQLKNIHL